MKDDFHGIVGMKRKKQNELLLQMALLYVSLQIMLKSVAYFVTSSLPAPAKRTKKDENVAHGTEIAMIRLN